MKSLLLLMLVLSSLVGCTRKYVDYDVLSKLEFRDNPDKRPIAPAMLKGSKDHLEQCFNQWLFMTNADANRNRYVPQAVQMLCPGSEWLIDARITNQWWTTLIFTRACVEITAHCPQKKERP
jgi:hypothetical protein